MDDLYNENDGHVYINLSYTKFISRILKKGSKSTQKLEQKKRAAKPSVNKPLKDIIAHSGPGREIF